MKRILFLLTITLILIASACKSNSLSGTYVCDKSNKKNDTTIVHEDYHEMKLDLTCVFEEFDFKGNSTVAIKMANGQSFTSYVIDKEYVRIKGDKSDLLLKLQNENTLIGEGIIQGTYNKK